jgi:hypothetical protein
MELVSELTLPPVVGKMYWVPAIHMDRFGFKKLWWPIHGHKHNDEEFFNFKPDHYHVDQRFLSKRHLRQHTRGYHDDPLLNSFGKPLSGKYAHLEYDYPGKQLQPGRPELRRMRCQRDFPLYPYENEGAVQKLNAAFVGKIANKGRLGLVCPHKQYPLGQLPADAEGIITCPLHGMRIRAIDGVCVGNRGCSKKEAA